MRCCKLTRRLSFISMIAMTASLFVVEIVVGYVTNSMALVADSFHMLSDVVSLLVGFTALRFSKVKTQTGRYTFGWARAEVVGALVNAVFLIALCFSIFVEALKRIAIPERLSNPKLVLIAGGIGLLVNVVGLFLFHGHGHGHSHGHSHGHGGQGHTHSHGDGHLTKGSEIDTKISVNELSGDVDIIDKSTSVPLLISEEIPEDYVDTASSTSLTDDKPIANVEVNGANASKLHIDVENAIEDATNTAKQDIDTKLTNSTPSSLNIRAVYLHVLGDALGSVIVMISAFIILYTSGEWTKYVDPSLSIIMVSIIFKTSFPLLKESAMILMQTAPSYIKIKDIQERLMKCVPGVLSVHELHIWQLAGSKIVASVHLRCKAQLDYMTIANQVKEFFHSEGIHSTTIQPEFVEHSPTIEPTFVERAPREDSLECLLKCDEVCLPSTCCGNATLQSTMSNKHGDLGNSCPMKIDQNMDEKVSETNHV